MLLFNRHFRKNIRLKGYDYSQAGLYFITICTHNMKCIYGKIVDEEMILNDYGNIAYNEWLKSPERFPNMELDVFQIMPNHMHGIIILKKNPVPASLADANTSLADANTSNADANTFNADANTSLADANTSLADANTSLADANTSNADANASNATNTQAGESPSPADTPKTIGDMVGAYKSLVANECLKIFIQTKIDEELAPDKIPKMGKIWQSNFYEHIIRDEFSYLRISEYIINNPKNWKGDKFYER